MVVKKIYFDNIFMRISFRQTAAIRTSQEENTSNNDRNFAGVNY